MTHAVIVNMEPPEFYRFEYQTIDEARAVIYRLENAMQGMGYPCIRIHNSIFRATAIKSVQLIEAGAMLPSPASAGTNPKPEEQ